MIGRHLNLQSGPEAEDRVRRWLQWGHIAIDLAASHPEVALILFFLFHLLERLVWSAGRSWLAMVEEASMPLPH